MPEHPLRSPEEEGIVLYHGQLSCTPSALSTDGPVIGKDDKERLCFSLVQIEYLQYYVLEYQKTDPLWLAKVGQLGFRSALQSDPESDECKEIAKQLEDAVLPEHLPLPSEWYLASKFKSIVSGPSSRSADWHRYLSSQRVGGRLVCDRLDDQVLEQAPVDQKQAGCEATALGADV